MEASESTSSPESVHITSHQVPSSWFEVWNNHHQSVLLVYLNQTSNVTIHMERGGRLISKVADCSEHEICLSTTQADWLFEFTSRVWSYMKTNYGEFSKDHPYLHLIIHNSKVYSDSNSSAYNEYASDPSNHNNATNNKRNLLDITYNVKGAWLNNDTRFEEMDLILNNLAYFVEYSFKGRYGSPSELIWSEPAGSGSGSGSNLKQYHPAWEDIFTLDVYNNVNFFSSSNGSDNHNHNNAVRYRNKITTREKMTKSSSVRDWLLPIYSNYSGNMVLIQYFQLLHNQFVHQEQIPKYQLDIGGFVHFWSGATNESLIPFAVKAFGWNETHREQFVEARKKFGDLNKFYTCGNYPECSPHVDVGEDSTTKTTTSGPVTETENVELENRDKIRDSREHGKGNNFGTEKSHSGIFEVDYKMITGIAVGGFTLTILVVGVLVTSIIFFNKKKIQTLQTAVRDLTKEEVKSFFEGDSSMKPDEAQALVMSLPFIKDFEIEKDRMILDKTKVLGSGQFATVIHGFIRNREDDEMVTAAMKTVKPNVDVICFKAFLSEAKIMAYLGSHENIVGLLGTCTANIKNREIIIALEFCTLGSLEDYLKGNRKNFDSEEIAKDRNALKEIVVVSVASDGNDNTASGTVTGTETLISHPSTSSTVNKMTTSELIRWSMEISNAMMYLTRKKVIHGDLASRNVLLTGSRVAKISDFGMARQFLNYSNYMKTSKIPVPWRWLAIECLKEMKFSTASDVWAFGVTMWEIFTLAEIPYGAWTYDLFFVDRLIAGDRLLKPKHASPSMYEIMKNCWQVEPAERPSFQEIHKVLNAYILKPDLTCSARTDNVNECPVPVVEVDLAETETQV